MKRTVAFLAALVFLAVTNTAFAQRGSRGGDTIEIRVVSAMPERTPWGQTLNSITEAWSRVTNGAVRGVPLHGRNMTEATMLSSIRLNQDQAALFTSFGLAEIIPEVMTLSVPFLVRDDAELSAVLKEVLPLLEERTQRTDFVILAWSNGGWVNIFSKDPVLVPDQLRAMPLATSASSENLNMVFNRMRFNLVPAETSDMASKIASGAITAIYQTPAAVAPLQLHRQLRNMLDMPVAPFVGGIVINRATWNRISPEMQTAIMNETRRIAAEFDAGMPKTVSDSISLMQRGGLTVNTPTAEQRVLWETDVQKAIPELLGTTFDRQIYDRISAILERERNRR